MDLLKIINFLCLYMPIITFILIKSINYREMNNITVRKQHMKKCDAAIKRKLILAAIDSGGDWRELAENLGVSTPTAYIEFNIHKIIRLAPYSPMLNPIEPVWSVIKAKVKSLLAEDMRRILNEENNPGISKTEFRTRELERLVQIGVSEISSGLCNRFIAKVQTLIPNVLNMENMHY